MTNKTNNIEIITGFKFAEIADVVFSGVFIKSQIKDLDLSNNIDVHKGDDEYIFIRKKEFKLSENDIIFCKTEYVKELFYILKKQCNFKNIILITQQSDLPINKKLFRKKPSCISKWYSSNVDYLHPNLIPIPLGVANFHPKNLNIENFKKQIKFENYFDQNKKLLYLNFNPNTNFSHRKNLYQLLNWSNSDETPINHNEYKENLKNHKFSLAPWGNGIDTHRFWEILYSGSIPITKNHNLYKSFNSFPKLLVKNYKILNKTFLDKEFDKAFFKKDSYNFEELSFNYWKSLILSNKKNGGDKKYIVINNNMYKFIGLLPDLKHDIKSKLKFFNRIRRYIYKKIGI